MLDVNLGSDGANAEELRLEFGAPLHMNGRAVIMHAARKVPASIQAVLSKRALSAMDLSKILMHQANANLIVKIAQTLGWRRSCFIPTLRGTGIRAPPRC